MMKKAFDQAYIATLQSQPCKIKRSMLHLKNPTQPTKSGLWGDTFNAPWEGGDRVNGLFGLVQWKSGQNAPPFPSPEEVQKRVPSVSVDTEKLFSISPMAGICGTGYGGSNREVTDGLDEPNQKNQIQTTWMGHASFLVQCSGVNILTDPVWVDRASPVQFAGPKRYVQPPIEIEDLPQIHIVTISHNHYDHLCASTVTRLHKAFDPVFVVPLGMKSRWFVPNFGSKWSKNSMAKVVELNWWEEVPCKFTIKTPSEHTLSSCVTITSTPVQHWTTRTSFDRNKELWCGFVYCFESNANYGTDSGTELLPPRLAYHAGDTAYCPMFLETAEEFFGGPLTSGGSSDEESRCRFDLAMIPIGAYDPRWFLQVQHVDPKEAVQVHLDLRRPRLSVGMHWGTWILTDEPIDEPPLLLKAEAQKAGLEEGEFVVLKHGESVAI
ncbi:hypothetical protein SARC_11294 [Sphaeroforma arctica JP610]|uniref:Metallo-beta-lactamase domain-containing protein n=1 Tax=Sphaeroforma arctica JP610 TaxID=667725 RepID=A0A0L0FHG9_9EUKA|nr:hypothetical protein SARC_11294 [Sphaeroforma arctica JP610]KNC76195.1 hypothetical protein SARC_11294 [Sphaeroforma arctica JP610]|eukprot:XP_014150097.1 hypothetical protein SARC_11294 [Sphaeroforma arctica JP610]